MEVLVKPELHQLNLKLPTCAAHELRCGHYGVYDLLELYLNTLSKIVQNTDNNSKALEDFVDSIVEWADVKEEDIAQWKADTLKAIGDALNGGDGTFNFVLKDGDVLWRHLSDEVKNKIAVVGGSDTGKNVSDIYLEQDGKLVVVLGFGDDAEYVRGLAPFARDISNEIPADSPLSTPDEANPEFNGGLMSVRDYRDLQELKNKQHNAPGNASKTEHGLVKVGSGIDVKDGVISIKLSNLGLTIDAEKGTMSYGGKTYKLTALEDVVTEVVEYGAPVVTSIVYNGYLSNNGYGSKPFVPVVTFSQKKVTHYSDNSEDNVEWIDGNLDTAGAAFHFTINKTTEGQTVNVVVNAETGEVTAGGSVWLENKKLGDVYATVEYNGKVGTLTSASGAVTQQKAVFTLSPESMSVGSEATNGKRITITKSAGVSIGTIQSSNTQVVTPNGIENNQIKLVIAENTGEQRSATITVNTNNANIPSKSVTITQAAGTAGTMMAYGMCKTDADADLIAAITAADKTKLNETDDYSATVESTFDDAVKVHFVALTNGSTYGVKAYSEANENEYASTSILTKTLTVDGTEMKVYYISQKMILDKTTFKIYK